MHLIVFDIDGTIVDSVGVDDECFIQTFLDLCDIDLSGIDWNTFEHVTDRGLTNEIFRTHFKRAPTEVEVARLKTYFYKLLRARAHAMTEIKGALHTLSTLMDRSDCTIAFATGGWKETALLKLDAIGFKLGEIPLLSSNEHFDRSKITSLAIEASHAKIGRNTIDSITYVGDGLWDLRTASELGINFIGVDRQRNHRLKNAGANFVLENLENVAQLISWVTRPR
ncbi:MAG: HAD hydrolase-like protein [Bacteroidota bacterium]